MKLVPWRRSDLVRPWPSLRNEINRLLDDSFTHDFLPQSFGGVREWTPALDISETEEAVVVKAELPGLEADDIEVTLQDDVLTIKGEKKEEKEEKTKSFHRVERSYGEFERSFRLPVAVKGDKVEAAFKNGVLAVELPKAEEAKTRSVKIKIE